jgi:hypothetical protein
MLCAHMKETLDFLLGCCHSQVDGHSDPVPTRFVIECFHPSYFNYCCLLCPYFFRKRNYSQSKT